jgi:diguanylate cyclase (GGDEF)-like protein/PAS domain S-box-containing protein
MATMHSLLLRQLKRHLIDPAVLPTEWQPFLAAVDEAYHQFDADRMSLERALELSSIELQQAHIGMRAVYERLIHSSVDGIFAFDCSYCYTVWNPAMSRIFGVNHLQTLGKCAFAVFPALRASGEDRHFQAALAGQTVFIPDRLQLIHHTGEQGYFEVLYAPLLSESEQIIGGLAMLRDITQRKRAEEAQKRQEEYIAAFQETAVRLNSPHELADLLRDMIARVGLLLETGHVFLTLVDADSGSLVIRFAAGAYAPLVGRRFRKGEGICGEAWQRGEMVIWEDYQSFPGLGLEHLKIWAAIPLFNGFQVIGIIGAARAEGAPAFQDNEIALLKQYAHLAAIALNQSALNEANARLASLATTDPLTRLPNHRSIMDRIDTEIARCQRAQSTCAILFLDIDHFKQINDTWGHRAGDVILREVGKRIAANVRQEDAVGRYGGEEFALILTNIPPADAEQVAEHIRSALAATPCTWVSEEGSQVAIPVTASIGVAIYPTHGTNRESLIEAADSAMYQAKHGGRNRVCVAGLAPGAPRQVQEHHRAEPAAQALRAIAQIDHQDEEYSLAQRMVGWAVTLAQQLGVDETDVEILRLATLLHDIGSFHISQDILRKAGPLTEQEWECIHGHPEQGQQLLRLAGGRFEQVSHIVIAHHERWDGTGYPYGLAGEAIPLGARILAVVDAYHAMTSDRPYREALTPEAASTEIQRCAGSQFDPLVVAAFCDAFPHFRALKPGNATPNRSEQPAA